jgi:hypothetical protein
MKHREAKLKGVVASEGDASRLLEHPGDIAIVERGVPRLLVMKCPDDCGDTLRINLDPRTSKAWRVYRDDDGLSLFPSVWRDTGCESHFIIWSDDIYWSDGGDRRYKRVFEPALRAAIYDQLHDETFDSATVIADRIGLVPWSVSAVLDALVEEGSVERRLFDRERRYRSRPRS